MRMKRRLVILTEIIAPYRIPVFNALAARDDVDPHIIFFSETDPTLRQWRVYKDEIRFSYEILPSWRRRFGRYNLLVNRGVGSALRNAAPAAVVCGGYSYLASWQAALWTKQHRIPLLLWSESTAKDTRRKHAVVEFMKRRFRHWCRAFVAAGTASRAYLLALGAPEMSVFIAPDAVDVRFYAQQAEKARTNANQIRAEHGLPPRYFLYVGRLVEEKGVFDLLAAYARLDENTRSQIGLVFVGDGPVRADLVRRASQIGSGIVKFCGWVHRERISEFYALADALILPTYSDTWGLVVNEAMACGLPIVASEAAGCVPDLVHQGENGFRFRPHDIEGLAYAMRTICDQPELAAHMRATSFELIQAYTPEVCAAGLMEAVDFACGGVR
jgi:glycosyltransferase involved in cell wall biosynthesis